CVCIELDLRMRREPFTRRHVALLLPLQLSRALAPHLRGVRHLALRDPMLPLRYHHEAPRTGMSLRLSERDLHVLAKCAVSKWLSTSQLQRLYFSGCHCRCGTEIAAAALASRISPLVPGEPNGGGPVCRGIES